MPIPSLIESPNRWAAVVGLLAIAIFFTFVAAGFPDKGKVAAFAFVALSGVVGLNWKRRTEVWFCGLIALFAILHLALIVVPDWQFEHGPALISFGPATILDFAVMALAISTLAKWHR